MLKLKWLCNSDHLLYGVITIFTIGILFVVLEAFFVITYDLHKGNVWIMLFYLAIMILAFIVFVLLVYVLLACVGVCIEWLLNLPDKIKSIILKIHACYLRHLITKSLQTKDMYHNGHKCEYIDVVIRYNKVMVQYIPYNKHYEYLKTNDRLLVDSFDSITFKDKIDG